MSFKDCLLWCGKVSQWADVIMSLSPIY